MKNQKKYAALFLILFLCLSMTACKETSSNGSDISSEEDINNGGNISMEDLEGFCSGIR